MAPDPTERSSEVMLGWACGSEGKKGGRSKSERGSQEKEGCEEEEEEDVGLSPTTPG